MKKRNQIFIACALTFASIALTGCGDKTNDSTDVKKEATVIINECENGSVSADKTSGYAGDAITLTFVPNTGYKVGSAKRNNEIIKVTSNKSTITLVEGNNTIDVTFVLISESGDEPVKQETKFNYNEVNKKSGLYCVPNTGSPNILVVPVEFNDLSNKWDSKRLNALDVACNGNKTDGSNDYWESLSSFYAKSSYGKFTPNIVVADVYNPSFTSKQFISYENSQTETAKGTRLLIEESYTDLAVDGSKVINNFDKYDYDKDGILDGVWFIYNEFNMSKMESYWAYTYWYFGENSSVKVGTYANMGAGFLYEDSTSGYDAHTLIHETGHMLGLDDYYSYDDGISYSAIGGLDMMDFNIGDHNAFSKYALGWTSPYIIENSTTITIKPFETSGDCLVLPSGYFNGSAFSEYVILDFYTPEGVCERDSNLTYSNGYKFFSKNGIRAYHVDSRIGKFKNDYYGNFVEFLDESSETVPQITNSYFYQVATSNTHSRSYNSKSDLITLLNRNNTSCYNKKAASNSSLWIEGDTITKTKLTSSLTSGKFNEGTTFNYTIKIDSITSSEATLTITVQ